MSNFENTAMSNLKQPLNKAPIEILKLFSRPMSEEDLQEIKSLLVKHLRKNDPTCR